MAKEFDISKIDYKDAIKLMERADDSKRLYEVFTDFIRMIAYSISNAIDPRHYDEREKKYMAIAEKYDKRALNECAKLSKTPSSVRRGLRRDSSSDDIYPAITTRHTSYSQTARHINSESI